MGASQKTKQNQTSTYSPTPEAGALYSNVLDQAQAAQSAYNPATAKTVAGFTDPQTQAFQNIAANQGMWQPNVNAASANAATGAAGITAGDISQFYNPFQSDVIDASLNQMGQQDASQTRAYMANEAAQGALGGNGIWLGKAALQGDQAQARNNTIANLRNTGWQQALAAAQADKSRALSGSQVQAGIGQLQSQLGASDASQLLASGNQQQAQQQNVNDTASTNALNEQMWPMQQAQWLASIASGIGPLTGGTTTGSGTSTTSQGKGAGNIIGAGLSLASMMSDERAKEDIEHVGSTHDGQPIYSFRYKGDPRTQMGLMAQDVEQRHPEAVSRGPGGLKMVNYDRALEDAYADGGGVGSLPAGLMGWADIKPATIHAPQLQEVRSPQMQQDEFDPQTAWDMGKKARGGIENLFGGGSKMPSSSSPAGGALAASGLQGYGSSGGGLGGLLSGIGGMFGFADGGYVPSDEEIRAIEMQESGGREDVVSPKGARGPMQVMPATGRDPGFGVTPLRDDSPEENRRFGRDYYAAMLNRYQGDRDAARIAYNGGPARADAWLKAGRNDSVIPAESANYYKQVEGRLGGVVAKGKSPEPVATGESYSGKADRASGGLLKRVFGIDFNPLNLSENERRALLVAGLSMMSSGNVGRGGLMGMQYLAGVEAGERDATTDAAKLQYQMRKDAADLGIRTRAEDRQQAKDTADQKWREGDVERKNTELTGDQKEYEAAKKEGFAGTFTDFKLAQKAAGSGTAGLPAEVGARIGLGRVFIGMVPDIEKRIDTLGNKGRADLALGRGEAAAVWRDIETGREALVRGLTGAGMSQTEAENAAARYQISPTDKAETMKEKVRNLKRDLEAVEAGAIEGKSGAMSRDFNKPTPVKTETIPGIPAAAPADTPKIAPRPAGTDDDLRRWAKEAIGRGAPPAVVQQRMDAWGVR